MIKKQIVSTILHEVRANASFSTRKPSTVTMEIDRRFSLAAYQRYLDQQENIDPDIGLIGFELVAVYEDGEHGEKMETHPGPVIEDSEPEPEPETEPEAEEEIELPFEDENSEDMSDVD